MSRILFSSLAGLALAAPACAAEAPGDTDAAATRNLRGCLAAGSGGAPRSSLAAAVTAIRSLCRPQIDALADVRVHAATAGLGGEDAKQAEQRAIRDLNDEIARAIATFTGLTR